MILRPLEPPPPAKGEFLPAWEEVERVQRLACASCWMITQPSHAALAGDLAAALTMPPFPATDKLLVRAIALHDAGWGVPDTQAIVQSRSVQQQPPQSFVATPLSEFLKAWEKSIVTSESVAPAGGYIVSRHFWRLAEHRVRSERSEAGGKKLKAFLQSEERRQKKLAAKQSLSLQQLEDLTDLLQFCDLLSLYFCCGSRQNVAFPQHFGIELRIENHEGVYQLDPPVIPSTTTFTVAALRHPATETSSQEIVVAVA